MKNVTIDLTETIIPMRRIPPMSLSHRSFSFHMSRKHPQTSSRNKNYSCEHNQSNKSPKNQKK